MSVCITGGELAPACLAAIARDGAPVVIAARARERMLATARVMARAVEAGQAIYGVTTGLGSRVVQPVSRAQAADFSLRTLRGRANGVGAPLPRELSRAAMAVRLNGLCAGGAGADPAVAEGLAALLNTGVTPIVPASGSIGAADLCLLAHVGLVLIGEGEAEHGGERMAADEALRRAGLKPIVLGPKDGLAICSSSAVSVGAAALAWRDGQAVLTAVQVSAALSMEGFRANLSPLDPRVVAARPAPGQEWAATGLRELLADGALAGAGVARRLQDPLSFRCASQIHGSLRSALGLLEAALIPELCGAADNPLILLDDEEVLSTGNFHVPALALALDATAIAVAQVASAITERGARLKSERLSGLPPNLVDGDPTRSGAAPLGKTAQSLTLEIRHLAAPLAIHALVDADGVEDDCTGAAQAALRLRASLERLALLVAIELLVAVQAIDLVAPVRLGRGTAVAHAYVRELIAPLGEDRPLGPEVQRLARSALADGELARRVEAAL